MFDNIRNYISSQQIWLEALH